MVGASMPDACLRALVASGRASAWNVGPLLLQLPHHAH